MTVKNLLLVILLIVYPFSSVSAQEFNVYGYTKYMFSSTKYPDLQNRLNDHLIHTRINTRWYPNEYLCGAAELRLRAYYGDSPADIYDFKNFIQSDYEFSDLDYFLWEDESSLGYGELDRLYLDYTRESLQVTAGRQRIAWGTTLVWNITDLFNPQSVLDFDYEEKPGVDAIRIQYYTGPVSRVELVYKPGETRYGATYAALLTTNAFSYDFFLLGALQNNRWVAGGAWAGSIRGGGFRGELKISESPQKGFTSSDRSSVPFGSSGDAVVSVTISGDYTFTNSFYIHTEALYNSNGKRRNLGDLQYQALEANMLSPAKWSLFQEFSYDITPLVRATVFTLWNPDDGSSITVPMINWSVRTNWDVTLVGFLTGGQASTEFGGYGNSGFVRIKYSF